MKLLMICMGNICRSPTAEAVVRLRLEQAGLADRVSVESAGTHGYHIGKPPDTRSQQAARRRGLDMSSLRARQVDPEDFREYDYLLVMDSQNATFMERMAANEGERRKVVRFLSFAPHLGVEDVPDPYYGGEHGFDRVLDLIEAAADGLIDHLRRELSTS